MMRRVLIVTAISALYLILSAWLIGLKTDQLFLVFLFNSLYYLSGATRRFILGFSVFIVFWILFDSMKAFPNYRYNTVHIESIYRAEKHLFGISVPGGAVLTPNEYWLVHQQTFLDVLSGFFYLCWIPLPLAFSIYYIYPAAPPWYVQQYGFGFNAHTPGNTAGLGRFDQFFHVSVFSGLYAKSSNVFAAMPSLHASYPLTVLYYGLRYRLRWVNILFGMIMAGIWFAAVYSGHHYVLDVLAGITCGLTGITLFNYLYGRVGWFNRAVKRWIAALEKPVPGR
jgi:membrane-associated phospholipid phosphatase